MIDWITAKLPLTWAAPINGGRLIRVRADGVVEADTHLRLSLTGSYDGRFTIRTVERGWVEISGNPLKFLQGHNLFGSSDLVGLVCDVMARLCELLKIPPAIADLAAWQAGDFTLSRVDVTEMLPLGARADVRAWLRAASEGTEVKWRGRGTFVDGTLYFGRTARGKRASRWEMALYCKGDEIEQPGHRLPESMAESIRTDLSSWADDKLRVELRLRTGELDRLGLRRGGEWTPERAERAFQRFFSAIEMGDGVTVPVAAIDDLKPALRATYELWRQGTDVRAIYPPRTFFRHRRALLEALGVDIRVPQPRGNVVPLRRVIVAALPAPVPAWARDAGVYHEPRRRSAS